MAESDDYLNDFVIVQEPTEKVMHSKLCAVEKIEEANHTETLICNDLKVSDPPAEPHISGEAYLDEHVLYLDDEGNWGGDDEVDWSEEENEDDLQMPFAQPQISSEFLNDENTLAENREQQLAELDSLKSIFDDDYGEIGVNNDSCVIRISCGRYEVRLMVDLPKTYPSMDPPIPTIIGAWWPEFNVVSMNQQLLSSFNRGNICVYDWTMIMSEYLQDLMERVVKKHAKKINDDDFAGQLASLVLELEKGLAFKDLEDENQYTDRFSTQDQDYIFKCVIGCLKKKKKRVPKVLKRIHRKLPTIVAKHLYWVLNIYKNYESVPLQCNSKYRNIPLEYKLHDIAAETGTYIRFDNASNAIQIFGAKKTREETAQKLVSLNAVKVLMGLLGYRQIKGYTKADLDVQYFPEHQILVDHQIFLSQCRSREFYEIHYTPSQIIQLITALQHYLNAYNKIQQRRQRSQFVHISASSRNAPFIDLSWGQFGLSKSETSKKSQVVIPLEKPFPNGTVVYHGTKACNVVSIMTNGLKINGGERTPANGAAYGAGIYTAASVNVPIAYAQQQAAKIGDAKYLCVFKCSAKKFVPVNSGRFLLIKNKNEIRITQLILYRTA